MKNGLKLILLVMLLTLSACQKSTKTCTEGNDKEAPISICSIEKGMSYRELYDKFSDRLLAYDIRSLAWKNDNGTYDVAVFANGNEVSAFAHFSPNCSEVESCGISLVNITEPERFYGRSESEFIAEYGQPHIDHGSGRYIPMYISQNGKLYYPKLCGEGAIIEGITELDLASETLRFFDGSKWTTINPET